MLNRLLIQDLSLQVSLGCTVDEQASLQEVRLSVELQFSTTPEACKTDELIDTICYADLAHIVTVVCKRQSYKTVERLTFSCFEELRKAVSVDIKIKVSVHKINPPVANLRGGVFFIYGDGL